VKAIESGSYSEALTAYVELSEKQDDMTKINEDVNEALQKKYDDIMDGYAKGTIEQDTINAIDKLAGETGESASRAYFDFHKVIKEINVSRSFFEQGTESYEKGDYSEAAKYFSYVDEIDIAHYSEAQENIETAETKIEEEKLKQYTLAKNEINELIDKGKYEDAMSKIRSLKYEVDDESMISELTGKLENNIVKNMEDKISAYFSSYDYLSAYNYVSGLTYNFDFDSIKNKLSSLRDDFVEYALNEAKKEADAKNYEGAASLIKTAVQALGSESSELNDAYTEYRKHLPIYLAEMEYMSSEGPVYVDRNVKDNTSTSHRHSLWVGYFFNNEYWVEYFTNGNYKAFTGICGCSYDNRSDKESTYFEVYGDGKLLYTSPEVTSGTIPFEFDIDISGVKILRIWYPPTSGRPSIAAIYDGMLIPVTENNE